MVPPLVAAEAVAHVEGPDGGREVAVAELAESPGRTVLRSGEWISTITVPLPRGEEGFRKLGGREAMAISIVNLAWRWTQEEDGSLSAVRIAVGSVAPTVMRAKQAEQELEGRRPSAQAISSAVAALQAAVSPIDDVRGSGWYRREVVGRLLEEALSRGEGG
jgi:CO/xanthine dehydrogenase FAD-binding subunit